MLNTTLIEILKTFSADEIKSFDDFIRSPYFNKKPTLVKLWDSIKKFSPDYNSNSLKRESIYKHMFPEKEFNYGVMKNLIYDFSRIVEKFIIIHSKTISNFYDRMQFLTVLNERRLSKHFEKELLSIRKSISGTENVDDDYFLKEYLLQVLDSEFMLLKYGKNISLSKNIIYDSIINEEKYLRKYYLLGALKQLNFFFSYKSVFGTETITSLYNAVHGLYNIEVPFEKILNIQYMLLQLSREKILKADFKRHMNLAFSLLDVPNLNNDTKNAVLLHLSNYCHRQFQQGEFLYQEYAFEIFRKIHEFKLFDGQLSIFRSAIIVAFGLKEIKWLDDFVKENLIKIDPQNRQDAENFYLAMKYFNTADNNKSLEHLSKLKSDDVFNRSIIKSYTIMNFYELSYFNGLYDQIEVFKKFLLNNKSYPDTNSKTVFNFLKYIKRIAKAKETDEDNYSHLKIMIEKEKIIGHKNWLLEKLSELKK